MRSLLILPLLVAANLQDAEWDTDAHVSLLQHQAKKVLADDEQPAHIVADRCVACGKNAKTAGTVFGFCVRGMQCTMGQQQADLLTKQRCPQGQGYSGQDETACAALAAAAPQPTRPPAPKQPPGPQPHIQRRKCMECADRADQQELVFGFCGVTMQCDLGANNGQVADRCPHARGAKNRDGCADLGPEGPPPPPPVAMGGGPADPAAQPNNADIQPRAVAAAPPAVNWDYATADAWKTLPGMGQCGGNRQSPIDVNRHAQMGRHGANVQAKYKKTRLTALVNDGHSLLVDGQFGTLQTHQGLYTAQQVKFHFPSEHTFDGVNFDGEMQIIHTLNNNANVYAVVSVPLKVGRPMSYQFDALHAIGLYNYPDDARLKPGQRKALSSDLDLGAALKPQLNNDFYRYPGSLSAPPCSQQAEWFVSSVPMKVGWRMPTDFNLEFGGGNNRPTQPQNGRPVFIQRFIPAAQPFAPQPDPPQPEAPEMQAPGQNNDDVLTGDDAEAEAQDANDAGNECEPGAWCKFGAKDGEPLVDDDGANLIQAETREAAKELCLANEDCIAIGTEDGNTWVGFSDMEGEGPFNGETRPDEAGIADPPPAAAVVGPPGDVQHEECTDCARLAQRARGPMGFCGVQMKCGTGPDAALVVDGCPDRNTAAMSAPECEKLKNYRPAVNPPPAAGPVEDDIPAPQVLVGPPGDEQHEECTDCARLAQRAKGPMGFCGVVMKCGVGPDAAAVIEGCPDPNTAAKIAPECAKLKNYVPRAAAVEP